MPKDWNDIDSESDENSDVQEKKAKVQTAKDNTENPTSPNPYAKQGPEQSSSYAHNKDSQHHHQQRERPKFLKDEELIEKIKDKSLEERKKIKLVRCMDQQLLKYVKSHKLVKDFREVKIQDKPSFSFVTFYSEEGLIQFIEEKIEQRYRFFLHPYMKTEKDKQREKEREERRRERQRDYKDNRNQGREDNRRQKHHHYVGKNTNKGYSKQENRQREQRKPTQRRGDGANRQRNRPQYEEDEEIQYASSSQREPKREEPKSREEGNHNHKQTPAYNFEIVKNAITIYQGNYSKNRIVDEVVYYNLKKDYSRIRILAHKSGLEKAYDLCELLYEVIGYGLQKSPEQKDDSFVELIVKEKCHMKASLVEFRSIGSNVKKSFEEVKKRNKYQITKDFSAESYIREFKDMQREICKVWSVWIIKAQGELIPQHAAQLLNFSWKLKKQLYLGVDFRVGTERKDVPYCILEINPETDKQKRPKVDASFVNSYLTTD